MADHLVTVLVVPPYQRNGRPTLGQGKAETEDLVVGEAAKLIRVLDNVTEGESLTFVAHELFHVFEDVSTYRRPLHWLMEGTAVASEHRILDPTDTGVGFVRYLSRFWQRWGVERRPLSGIPNEFTRNTNRSEPCQPTSQEPECVNTDLWYGSGILFRWWVENLPRGDSILRELWAPGLSRRDGTRRLEAVIEAHAPSRDFSAELLRASVATMLLNGPAPYRFELGSELGAPFVPEAVVPDRPLETIQRENDAVAPWAALLRRIRAEDKRDPGAAEPLFITVEPNDPERLRVALVETSSRFEEGNSKRVELLELEDDGRGTFVVPRFAADVGETTSIDIVAVNSSPRAYRRLRWSYAFGGPPTLDRVRIEVGGETVYDASWTSPELPDDILSFNAYLDLARRELDIGRNSLAEAVEPGAGTLDDLVVELEFSKPVRLDDVTLGEFSFQLDGANELATEHTLRETSVDLSDASGELQLTVDASDEGGLRLDAAPSSPAALADDGEGWRAYEADGPSEQRAGGVDRNHVMHLGLGVTYLAEFRLRVDEAVVYDAHWNDRSNTRTLDVVTDEAIDPSGALGSGDVELVFNRPVDLPEVRLGEEPVEVVALADGRRFFGTIDAAMLRRLVGAGGGFRVSA